MFWFWKIQYRKKIQFIRKLNPGPEIICGTFPLLEVISGTGNNFRNVFVLQNTLFLRIFKNVFVLQKIFSIKSLKNIIHTLPRTQVTPRRINLHQKQRPAYQAYLQFSSVFYLIFLTIFFVDKFLVAIEYLFLFWQFSFHNLNLLF